MAKTGFYQSSLTKKFIMALFGLFLIVFLFVHMGINLLLCIPETEEFASRDLFNLAAHFMGSNILIKVFEIVLFLGFIIHIVYGIILQVQNWLARPNRYKIEGWSHTSVFSKFMIHTGIIIFIFLVIHLFDFYFKAKFGHAVETVMINGKEYHDLGALVEEKFRILWFVVCYVIAFVFLGFHLNHAFQSAFQSLGLSHTKYTPIIKALGTIVSIIIPAGFTFIALFIYFN